MNISLTPELDMWVNNRVKSGLYNSSSEVVREGLRLLKEKEEQKEALRNELKEAVKVGIDQLDSGFSRELNTGTVDHIKMKFRK
jgi:antitoxin ParD1/3/4